MKSLAYAAFALLLPMAAATTARADPATGFVEDFPGTSIGTWEGGAPLSNPGTGGLGGAGDGYLYVSTTTVHHLGANSPGPEYFGDWVAAGVTQVRMWINDVGPHEALELHFAIGNTGNFWQYDVGFHPPTGQWAEYVVDLSSSANWTRIIGAGTFPQALQNVERVLVRHDLAPYGQIPDGILAGFGLDHVVLVGGVTPVESSSWGRIKRLYR